MKDQNRITEKQAVKEFNKFDSTNINALSNFNKKAAKKAIQEA